MTGLWKRGWLKCSPNSPSTRAATPATELNYNYVARGYIDAFAEPDAVLVLDEVCDLTKGRILSRSAAAVRETARRIEKGQVAVFLTYATRREHARRWTSWQRWTTIKQSLVSAACSHP